MPKRLVFALVVLMTLVAVPLGASAAAPATARVTTTSWQDLLGREVKGVCEAGGYDIDGYETLVQTTVSYSGVGSGLAGNGTGTFNIVFYEDSFRFNAKLFINGQERNLEGGAELICVLPDFAIVNGRYNFDDRSYGHAGDHVGGTLTGTISDGVHPSQGGVSLILSVNSGRSSR